VRSTPSRLCSRRGRGPRGAGGDVEPGAARRRARHPLDRRPPGVLASGSPAAHCSRGRRRAAQPSCEQMPALPCHRLRLGIASGHGARRQARHEPGVLTGARCHGLPAEVACDGCPPEQRQSGFSPETPVISREIRGIGGTPSRGRSSPFAGTFSACTQSHDLLAMQKVEGSNPSKATQKVMSSTRRASPVSVRDRALAQADPTDLRESRLGPEQEVDAPLEAPDASSSSIAGADGSPAERRVHAKGPSAAHATSTWSGPLAPTGSSTTQDRTSPRPSSATT
jgi:hypothetical protein